jgi:hypothetical protein
MSWNCAPEPSVSISSFRFLFRNFACMFDTSGHPVSARIACALTITMIHRHLSEVIKSGVLHYKTGEWICVWSKCRAPVCLWL